MFERGSGSPSGDSKRPTNLFLRGDLIEAARAARVNLSALLERALIEELARLNRLEWHAENLQAIFAYNDHVLQHGSYRLAARSGRSL